MSKMWSSCSDDVRLFYRTPFEDNLAVLDKVVTVHICGEL